MKSLGEGESSRVAAGAMHEDGATMSHDGEIKTAVSRMPHSVLTVKNESAVSTAATHHETPLSQVISRIPCAEAQVVSHMGDSCEPDSLQIISQAQPEVDAREHAENGSPVVVPVRALYEENSQDIVALTSDQSPTFVSLASSFVMHRLDNFDSPDLPEAVIEGDSHLPMPAVAPTAKSMLRANRARTARASHSDGEDETNRHLQLLKVPCY